MTSRDADVSPLILCEGHWLFPLGYLVFSQVSSLEVLGVLLMVGCFIYQWTLFRVFFSQYDYQRIYVHRAAFMASGQRRWTSGNGRNVLANRERNIPMTGLPEDGRRCRVDRGGDVRGEPQVTLHLLAPTEISIPASSWLSGGQAIVARGGT